MDPASNEYDLHLARNKKGKIIPLSDVGNYMIHELKFDIRPTSLMYKLDLLLAKRDELAKINSKEALILHRDVTEFIEELRSILKFENKE